MASDDRKLLTFTGLTGRDGSTPSEIAIPPTRCKEALNVDFYRAAFARKRPGSSAVFNDTTGEAFKGCLYPVRARLIRADGSVVEKQGCRSQLGWTRVASETVSLLISATVGGSPAVAVAGH